MIRSFRRAIAGPSAGAFLLLGSAGASASGLPAWEIPNAVVAIAGDVDPKEVFAL